MSGSLIGMLNRNAVHGSNDLIQIFGISRLMIQFRSSFNVILTKVLVKGGKQNEVANELVPFTTSMIGIISKVCSGQTS
jgi:hypothetical protein